MFGSPLEEFIGRICQQEWQVLENLINGYQFDTRLLNNICVKKIVETQSGTTYCTPFQWACIKKAPQCVLQVMINKGGNEMLSKCDQKLNSNGLQWAIANRASSQVIKNIVENYQGQERKHLIAHKNSSNENAIHVAIRFHNEIEVIRYLIDQGGDDLLENTNSSGCLCLHYACRHHSDPKVIDVLYEKKNDSMEREDHDKNWPLVHAFDGGNTKDIVDHLLSIIPYDTALKYLSKYESAKSMMFWINRQIFEDKKDLLARPLIREVLNASFIRAFYLRIMFCDLYAQILLVAIFSIGIDQSVVDGTEAMDRIYFWIMVGALLYRGVREIYQIAKSPLRTYLIDLWNIIDLILILLVTRSAFILYDRHDLTGGNGVWNETGVWVCMTTGFVWTELMLLLSHFRHDVLIFVSAVGSIFVRLTSYYFVVIMAIIAYGNMFYLANLMEGANKCNATPFPNGTEAICSRQQSYLTSLSMFLSQQWIYLDDIYEYPLTGFLSLGIALVMGLVFLTILIAEIQKIYTEVDKLGSYEFWKRRLTQMCEINQCFGDWKIDKCTRQKDGKSKGRQNLSSLSRKNLHDVEDMTDTQLKDLHSWLQHEKCSDGTNLHGKRPIVFYRLYVFFWRASWNEILLPDEMFETILWPKYKFCSRLLIAFLYLFIILPISAIVFLPGFFTFGFCWSSTVKMQLFGGPIYENPSTDKHVKTMACEVRDIRDSLRDGIQRMETILAEMNQRNQTMEGQMGDIEQGFHGMNANHDQNARIIRESIDRMENLLENMIQRQVGNREINQSLRDIEAIVNPPQAVVMLVNDDINRIIRIVQGIQQQLPA